MRSKSIFISLTLLGLIACVSGHFVGPGYTIDTPPAVVQENCNKVADALNAGNLSASEQRMAMKYLACCAIYAEDNQKGLDCFKGLVDGPETQPTEPKEPSSPPPSGDSGGKVVTIGSL